MNAAKLFNEKINGATFKVLSDGTVQFGLSEELTPEEIEDLSHLRISNINGVLFDDREGFPNERGVKNMTTTRAVVDDRAFEKEYNIEWYLANGNVQTTSATLVSIENGYTFFRYPSGGLFMIKDEVIRSLECLE